MSSTQNLTVFYVLKGEDVKIAFSKAYTMLEHFSGVPNKEGKTYAISQHGECLPITKASIPKCEKLEEKIAQHLGLKKDALLINQVHNPMLASYKSHCLITVDGTDILYKQNSIGIEYAKVNHNWLAEFNANSKSCA